MQAITAKRVLIVVIVLFCALLSAVPFHAAFAQPRRLWVRRTASDPGRHGGDLYQFHRHRRRGVWPAPRSPGTNCTITGRFTGDGAPSRLILTSSAHTVRSRSSRATLSCRSISHASAIHPVSTVGSPASTNTGGTLTLSGPRRGLDLQESDQRPAPLTGTNFSVVMEGGGSPCNVYWWVAKTTMTNSSVPGKLFSRVSHHHHRWTLDGMLGANRGDHDWPPLITGCEQMIQPAGTEPCNQGWATGPRIANPATRTRVT